jgi:hypothetical protein
LEVLNIKSKTWECHLILEVRDDKTNIFEAPTVHNVFNFSIHLTKFILMTNPLGVKWYLIVVFISISIIISYIKHLFTCILAICVTYLEECLYISLFSISMGYLPIKVKKNVVMWYHIQKYWRLILSEVSIQSPSSTISVFTVSLKWSSA